MDAGAGVARSGGPARIRDASATVAHLHLAGPDEEARAREVDALDALSERPGDGVARTLVEVARLVEYPILFVSIVRGERVGYRAQLGLTPALSESRDMRREMTFCTHCVSADMPLVVQDAASEPFFRGSKMVQRFSIRSYVGVPLRTSSGLAIGTLCAMDSAPRRAEPEIVQILERFAEPVAAEIERVRDEPATARRDALVERAPDGAAIYAASWFAHLLDIELARAARGRPAALIALRGVGAREAAALARPGEVVGRAPGDPGALALLLSGTEERTAAARCDALRTACPRAAYAPAERGGSVLVWWSRAAGAGGPGSA
jgi:GAF domain-containing protein